MHGRCLFIARYRSTWVEVSIELLVKMVLETRRMYLVRRLWVVKLGLMKARLG